MVEVRQPRLDDPGAHRDHRGPLGQPEGDGAGDDGLGVGHLLGRPDPAADLLAAPAHAAVAAAAAGQRPAERPHQRDPEPGQRQHQEQDHRGGDGRDLRVHRSSPRAPPPRARWPAGRAAGRRVSILLTDVHDGRLTVDDRELPLAGPVRVRLTAYLDDRARRFPQTLNPYLLVNRRSAPRTTPVAARYPWHRYDLQPRPLREDRILHEIHATGGDVRRICDLFGLSINAAMRYTAVLEHPTSPPTATGVREPKVRDRLTTTPEPLGSPPRNLQNS